VVLADINGAGVRELAAGLGDSAVAVTCDVARKADVDAMVRAATEAFGGLDIMVNNAGIAGPTANVEDVKLEDWRRTLAVNLDATYMCCRRVVPLMKKNRGGAIINLSSSAGIHGFARRTPYASAKWAIVGLTKSLALELGPFGIRVNAICPGAVEGDRIERVIRARAEAMGVPYDQVKKGFTSTAALQRMVTEDEVARVALFLVSDLAAGVTGQTINVDAGSIMN
jgi:NAD(P)-dependent dehydrogenase (short-subunit alcohol dehydrogenase family)